MKKIVFALLMVVTLGFTAMGQAVTESLKSPDGRMEVTFRLLGGTPYYELKRDGKQVIAMPSRLGFVLEWRDDLDYAFVLKDVERSTFDEVWHPVLGEEANIRNHYNEMLVTLEQPIGSVKSMDHSTEKRPTIMQIRFRLYDDGMGFRYEFPMRYNGVDNALVCFWFKEELTSFNMTGDHTAWWIPGDYDTQEFNYTESRLSEIDSLYDESHKDGGWPWTDFSRTGVQTALQMKTDDGLYINIHEAATLDFPTMHLNLIDNGKLKIENYPGAAANSQFSILNLCSARGFVPMPQATEAVCRHRATHPGALSWCATMPPMCSAHASS